MLLRLLGGLEQRSTGTPFQVPMPGQWGGGRWLTGTVPVDELSVLGLPAAWRCVNLIADTIATLPLEVYRGQDRLDPPTFIEQPEPDRTRLDTISGVVTSLLLRGNAYQLVAGRNAEGWPTTAVLLNPDAVAYRLDRGQLYYVVNGTTVDPTDMIHTRGLTLPGHDIGLGVIQAHRLTLGHAISGEDKAQQLHHTGSLPAGVLTFDGTMTADEAERYKAEFMSKQGGRQYAPALLTEGMKYEPLGFNPSDMEFLDTRKYSGQQICQLFGVPSFLAGVPSSESRTYQTVQQDSAAFVRFTLRPWLARIESVLSMFLPRGQTVKFNLDELLRADTLDRYRAHQIGLAAGFLGVPEVRASEGLQGDEPPGRPDPPPMPATDDEPDDEEGDDDE